jgi:hypothetical protein
MRPASCVLQTGYACEVEIWKYFKSKCRQTNRIETAFGVKTAESRTTGKARLKDKKVYDH